MVSLEVGRLGNVDVSNMEGVWLAADQQHQQDVLEFDSASPTHCDRSPPLSWKESSAKAIKIKVEGEMRLSLIGAAA